MTLSWIFYNRNNINKGLELVSGLALSPDNSKLAVYAFNQNDDFETGDENGYIYIVDAYSGLPISIDINLFHATAT